MENRRSPWLRRGVQGAFLVFLLWTGYQHQLLGGGPGGAPPVDALCPLGGLEGFWSWITEGVWLRRLAPSVLVLLGTVLALTLLFGRVFCGWICPLGTIAEGTAAAGRRLGLGGRHLPPAVDRPLRGLKYVVLVAITVLAWVWGTLAWRGFDPWVAVMHIPAGWSALEESPWSFVVLGVGVLGAGLFIERFWCRYLCPLGALLALFARFSAVKIRRSSQSCIRCDACHRECPVDLNPQASDAVTSPECLACGRCAEACPVPATLNFSWGPRSLSVLSVGLLTLLVFFGAYGTAKLTGWWQTTVNPAETAARAANPTEGVYGWMSLNQVAATVKLSPQEVLAIAQLSPDTPLDVSMKKIPGLNDETVRDALAAHFAAASAVGSAGAPVTIGNPEEIRGAATLEDVARAFDLDPSKILETAGWPPDVPRDKPLKEIGSSLGKDVSEIRSAVIALQKATE